MHDLIWRSAANIKRFTTRQVTFGLSNMLSRCFPSGHGAMSETYQIWSASLPSYADALLAVMRIGLVAVIPPESLEMLLAGKREETAVCTGD